jgi:hypothetical protein
MSTIVTRAGKGSALTHNEVDANFTNLNTDKLQSGDTVASLTITSADINGGTIDGAAIGSSSASTGAFTTVDATTVEVTNISAKDGTANITLADTTGIATFSKATVISTTDNTNAALTITQTGTGNAFVVEDETSPDSSPFVIDAEGKVVSGNTVPVAFSRGQTTSTTAAVAANVQTVGGKGTIAGANIGSLLYNSTTATAKSGLSIARTRATDTTSRGIVQSGDVLGGVDFLGDDGTNGYVSAGQITAVVDGTPGTNDMPGRLVFSTTADGASSPTERMRISSNGNVGIGMATNPIAPLHIGLAEAGGEAIRLSFNTGTATQSEVSIGFGRSLTAVYPNAAISGQEFDTNDLRGNLLFYTRDSDTDVAPTERMRITSTGLVTLAASSGLSISSTAVTSPAAADGNVFSGTYTPTLTNSTNVAASTAAVCQYMRVGNVVTVSGQVFIDVTTTATDSILLMSLPIASDFSFARQCAGTGASITAGSYGTETIGIMGNTASDVAEFRLRPTSVANLDYRFSFTYLVI